MSLFLNIYFLTEKWHLLDNHQSSFFSMYKTTYIEVTKYATVCQAFDYTMCLIYKAIYIGLVSRQLSAKFLSILSHLQSYIQWSGISITVCQVLSHLCHIQNCKCCNGISTIVCQVFNSICLIYKTINIEVASRNCLQSFM